MVADAKDGTRHVADLDDGSRMSRATSNSVTHESDLDAFLSTAELAETEFAAERASIRVVSQGGIFSAGDGTNGPIAVAAGPAEPSATATADRLLLAASNPYLLTAAEEAAALAEHERNKARLTVPRRPKWTDKTTAAELQRAEKDAFLEWRRNLAELEEVHGLLLTPFERNLEIWRQLWRVVERSDLVVQIVDARNPLLFRSEDLERYVESFGTPEGPMPTATPKKNLLVVNKADFLTVAQRRAWAEFFNSRGIRFAWFSAALAKKQQEEDKKKADEESNHIDGLASRRMAANDDEGSSEDANSADGNSDDEEARLEKEMAEAAAKLRKTAVSKRADLSAEEDGEEDENETPAGDEPEDEDLPKTFEDDSRMFLHAHAIQSAESDDDSTRILSVAELLTLLETECPPSSDSNHKPTVGMVGYPNVGKSSTINAIAGSKKVSVSATPGKTKHFQTIHLPQTSLLLCDCPGLVFPTFATTKADLVTQGILPVDQMREHTGPAALMAMRIPRRVFEWTYGLVVRKKSKGDKRQGYQEDYCRPEELLQSYASELSQCLRSRPVA